MCILKNISVPLEDIQKTQGITVTPFGKHLKIFSIQMLILFYCKSAAFFLIIVSYQSDHVIAEQIKNKADHLMFMIFFFYVHDISFYIRGRPQVRMSENGNSKEYTKIFINFVDLKPHFPLLTCVSNMKFYSSFVTVLKNQTLVL